MSKKVFILATSRCGYCKQAKAVIESTFPDLEDDQFTYFEYDVDDVTEEAEEVLSVAKSMRVRGVPFTTLMSDGKVTGALRGFDRNALIDMINKVIE